MNRALAPSLPNVGDLEHSILYSEELGIALKVNTDKEVFKWFLASKLLGAHISERIAIQAYRSFVTYRLLTPQRIVNAGWDYLVNPVLREGGYVRYDESTATKLLKICQNLIVEYDGSLKKLHDIAADSNDLELRLLNFYGIGPVTVNIFLRELRPFWEKSNPEPLPLVWQLAELLGIDRMRLDRKSETYARVEAGLIRHKKLILQHGRTTQPR